MDKKVPKLRFKGFTDDWEQRKVSDFATKTYGGGTPSTSNQNYWNGDIPWIQSSDLQEEKYFNITPRKFLTKDGLSHSAATLAPENSIAIVTRVGVGKLALMPFSYTTSQDFLSLSNLQVDPKFAVYSLSLAMHKAIQQLQGTSIKGVTKDNVLASNILLPVDNREQRLIGKCLFELDNLITLHQRKLEALQQLKKFLLQTMFL